MKGRVGKSDQKRIQIIREYRELVESGNHGGLTMMELTERLGVARGTIYYYFDSKQELLDAVVDDIIDNELEEKIRLIGDTDAPGGSALDKLKLLIIGSADVWKNQNTLTVHNKSVHGAFYVKLLGGYITKLSPLFASVIIQGCEEGLFETDYPLESAEFVIAGLQYLMQPGLYPWSEQLLSRRMNAVPSLLESQLGAAEGIFNFLNEIKN